MKRVAFLLALLGSLSTLDVAEPPAPAPVPELGKAAVNGFKTIIAAPEKPVAVKVAIYRGDGAPDVAAEDVKVRVDSIPGATVRMLTATDVGPHLGRGRQRRHLWFHGHPTRGI